MSRRLLVVFFVGLLVGAAACSSDSKSDAESTTTDSSSETTESDGAEPDGDATLDKEQLDALDYSGALLTAEQLTTAVPGEYKVLSSGGRLLAKGLPLHQQCGQDVAPPATAGAASIFEDSGKQALISSGVKAFATPDEAAAAVKRARELGDCCSTFDDDGDLMVHHAGPPPADVGDEVVVGYNSPAVKGPTTEDYLVRRGQFVSDLHVAAVGSSPWADSSVFDAVAKTGAEQFVEWADDQLAG